MPAQNITAANSTAYRIPMIPQNQEFDVSLAGVTYHLRVKWNSNPLAQSWVLDIMDSQQNPILSGIPMVTGCDLLEQYAYKNIGGAMIVQSTTDPDEVPDYASLGVTGFVFLVTPLSAS